MNAVRRKKLDKAVTLIRQACEIVEDAQFEEEDALDNLPEAFQDGDRGTEMQERIDAMDTAKGHLEEAIAFIEDASE